MVTKTVILVNYTLTHVGGREPRHALRIGGSLIRPSVWVIRIGWVRDVLVLRSIFGENVLSQGHA